MPLQVRRAKHCFSPEGLELLEKLLGKNPTERFRDPEQIRGHAAFKEILFHDVPDGWAKMLHKQVGGYCRYGAFPGEGPKFTQSPEPGPIFKFPSFPINIGWE